MENSVDPDQMPHTVSKGLSVPIIRVITVGYELFIKLLYVKVHIRLISM